MRLVRSMISASCGTSIAGMNLQVAMFLPPWTLWWISPYVNHIPTMTGGVGSEQLSRVYKYHFEDSNLADTKLIPISRTVGADRLVDEILFCFTHDCEFD